MATALKKPKKRKEGKKSEPKKDLPPQVVTRSLADNTYVGIIREDHLGSQFLETGSAKYVWSTGITYEGPFSSSRIEGKGRFAWPDGSSYEGELHNGKRHGEGTYVAADGVTRYEGQWCMGKREGRGRLVYNASGTAFYEGSWKDGKKHGEGKQVWPSGNAYEGQWVHGKMRGQGTMTWRTGNTSEQYTGYWEDNNPHGEGKHTWHAAEPLSELGAKDEGLRQKPVPLMVQQQQQQMNNCYSGQWRVGKRDGRGTFYYANGAYYQGEWQEHVKQGQGRHTFEDGSTYEGPFEGDRMKEQQPGHEAEENPVCRRIDISDLEVRTTPPDHRGFALTAGSGYTEPAKILREVHNTLLRHLAELKDLYNRYRTLLPMPGEDPFVLRNHQLWLFARDAGLITPSCPLARIDRFVFSGPRHHREVAPEDSQEARALTPRLLLSEHRGSADSVSDGGSPKVEQSGAASQAGSQAESSEEEESASLDSSMPSPAHVAFDIAERAGSAPTQKTPPATAESPPEGMRQHARRTAVTGLQQMEGEPAPKQMGQKHSDEMERGPRAEAEGSGELQHSERTRSFAEIHRPSQPLLFRQFLEGVVRLSLARFPHERGLEPQIHRLFKQHILRMSDAPSSEDVWTFLVNGEVRQTLKEFEAVLLRLFRSAVVGGGRGVGGDGPCMGRFSEFGAPRRRLGMLARLDETIRVKDVLRLLDSAGLLRPMPASVLPREDPCAPVSLLEEEEGGDDGVLSADENGSGGSNSPEQDAVDDEKLATKPDTIISVFPGGASAFGANASYSAGAVSFNSPGPPYAGKAPAFSGQPSSHFGGVPSGLDFMPKSSLLSTPGGATEVSESLQSERASAARKSARRERQAGREREAAAPSGDRGACSAADLAQCDLSVTALRVLKLVAEVLSPGALEELRWELNPERFRPGDESISLLEYVEMELVFPEFIRLLLQLADLGTFRDAALCERLSFPRRFEGFLRHVFLPSLEAPYAPPEPQPTRHSDASAEAAPTPGDTASAAGQEVPDNGSQVPDGAQGTEADPIEAIAPPQTLELWRGFDGGAATVELAQAPRRWPEGYEQEVSRWC